MPWIWGTVIRCLVWYFVNKREPWMSVPFATARKGRFLWKLGLPANHQLVLLVITIENWTTRQQPAVREARRTSMSVIDRHNVMSQLDQMSHFGSFLEPQNMKLKEARPVGQPNKKIKWLFFFMHRKQFCSWWINLIFVLLERSSRDLLKNEVFLWNSIFSDQTSF